ncbi:hypothetical protein PJ267_15630 [Arthrobacter sp. OVS8]|nr:hypothetical protein PJ267_15630 [Arthrobacter sp. OVS8]
MHRRTKHGDTKRSVITHPDDQRGDNERAAKTPRTAKPGAVDWIAAGLAGLLLISATACASPGTAPAVTPSASPTAAGGASPR